MLSEATLLVVAAQAGFIGGPKCLANMAHDSWVPHWFGSLSERLASHNGILLIGAARVAALWANRRQGLGADHHVLDQRVPDVLAVDDRHDAALVSAPRQASAVAEAAGPVCVRHGAVRVDSGASRSAFKFREGAWKTVVVTGVITGIGLLIRRYYDTSRTRLKGLDESLGTIEVQGEPNLTPPDPEQHTAVILVGGYSGLGVHTLLNAVRFVPNHFKNMIFISVGVVDSGNFKGVEEARAACGSSRRRRRWRNTSIWPAGWGFPSTSYMAIGTDVVDELEQLCRVGASRLSQAVVFAGQLVFQRETWYGALLHNQTAYSLQRRLQWDGVPMVILPTRVRESSETAAA